MIPKDIFSGGAESPTIERTTLRLALFGLLIVGLFVALFSRLWFLQVLASDDFQLLARENRVRRIESEPERGRILDRNGEVLVDNRNSLSITLDWSILEKPVQKRAVLKRLSRLLDVPVAQFEERLADVTISPYKPIALARDVPLPAVMKIGENPENFPGVETTKLPVRIYPQGKIAAQILGYVGEISPEQLESDYFSEPKRPYNAGDVVGKLGLERSYDKMLRGKPEVKRLVVNSANKVVDEDTVAVEEPGRDLITSLDVHIQRLSERALKNGIEAARGAGYEAPDGGVIVMDPNTGEVRAMASYPSYDPGILADGFSTKEFAELGMKSETGDDDAMLNRPIQAQVPPGSTFKVVTAGAALTHLPSVDASTFLPCRPFEQFGGNNQTFRNWSSIDYGSIGFARSLEISCDTFYYLLGWDLEEAYGAANGDGSEKFQDYMHLAGFGQPTGIDIPFEAGGVVPDEEWLAEYCAAVGGEGCDLGWLPGYTVNMSIGQGSLAVSPIQMAVTYAALVNGGNVVQPRLGVALGEPAGEIGSEEETLREFKTKVAARLPLDDTELSVLREGLEDVISGPNGTAGSVFAGFPLDKFPVAGKTGTAQIGALDSGQNYAWFVAYAPSDDPEYVIAAYIHKAGHGGESAAPVVRQIFEGIFGVDDNTDVQFRAGADASG